MIQLPTKENQPIKRKHITRRNQTQYPIGNEHQGKNEYFFLSSNRCLDKDSKSQIVHLIPNFNLNIKKQNSKISNIQHNHNCAVSKDRNIQHNHNCAKDTRF